MTPLLSKDLSPTRARLPVLSGVPTLLQTPPAGLPVMRIHRPDDPLRQDVEMFITQLYRSHFDAAVSEFSPFVVSLRDHSGIIAAAGYRCATDALFLERYLPVPIDVLLGAHCPASPGNPTILPARRSGIVEVGHLAAARPGAGKLLFQHLAHHLAGESCEWVVNTATRSLRALFQRIGFSYVDLGAADAERAGIDPRDWGCYYHQSPRVIAGRLSENLLRLPVPGCEVAQ